MANKRTKTVAYSIDLVLATAYSALCTEAGINMSKRVQKFMAKDIERVKQYIEWQNEDN